MRCLYYTKNLMTTQITTASHRLQKNVETSDKCQVITGCCFPRLNINFMLTYCNFIMKVSLQETQKFNSRIEGYVVNITALGSLNVGYLNIYTRIESVIGNMWIYYKMNVITNSVILYLPPIYS